VQQTPNWLPTKKKKKKKGGRGGEEGEERKIKLFYSFIYNYYFFFLLLFLFCLIFIQKQRHEALQREEALKLKMEQSTSRAHIGYADDKEPLSLDIVSVNNNNNQTTGESTIGNNNTELLNNNDNDDTTLDGAIAVNMIGEGYDDIDENVASSDLSSSLPRGDLSNRKKTASILSEKKKVIKSERSSSSSSSVGGLLRDLDSYQGASSSSSKRLVASALEVEGDDGNDWEEDDIDDGNIDLYGLEYDYNANAAITDHEKKTLQSSLNSVFVSSSTTTTTTASSPIALILSTQSKSAKREEFLFLSFLHHCCNGGISGLPFTPSSLRRIAWGVNRLLDDNKQTHKNSQSLPPLLLNPNVNVNENIKSKNKSEKMNLSRVNLLTILLNEDEDGKLISSGISPSSPLSLEKDYSSPTCSYEHVSIVVSNIDTISNSGLNFEYSTMFGGVRVCSMSDKSYLWLCYSLILHSFLDCFVVAKQMLGLLNKPQNSGVGIQESFLQIIPNQDFCINRLVEIVERRMKSKREDGNNNPDDGKDDGILDDKGLNLPKKKEEEEEKIGDSKEEEEK
jgi:hypothetical protein